MATKAKKTASKAKAKSPKGDVFKLTENAIKHLIRMSTEMEKPGQGLKVEVIPGGCSGYKYFMDFEEAPGEEDIVMDLGDVKVFVHKDSVEMLEGTELDYVDSFQGAGFQFNNPNVKSKCGCGKSFC